MASDCDRPREKNRCGQKASRDGGSIDRGPASSTWAWRWPGMTMILDANHAFFWVGGPCAVWLSRGACGARATSGGCARSKRRRRAMRCCCWPRVCCHAPRGSEEVSHHIGRPPGELDGGLREVDIIVRGTRVLSLDAPSLSHGDQALTSLPRLLAPARTNFSSSLLSHNNITTSHPPHPPPHPRH